MIYILLTYLQLWKIIKKKKYVKKNKKILVVKKKSIYFVKKYRYFVYNFVVLRVYNINVALLYALFFVYSNETYIIDTIMI